MWCVWGRTFHRVVTVTCVPFPLSCILWQYPASAGNDNTKIWNAEPRVQFYEPGNYHTVCVGVLWVYRVCVNEVVIETGPLVVWYCGCVVVVEGFIWVVVVVVWGYEGGVGWYGFAASVVVWGFFCVVVVVGWGFFCVVVVVVWGFFWVVVVVGWGYEGGVGW